MNHWYTTGSYTLYPEKSEKILSHEFNGRYIYDSDTTFSLLNSDAEVGYALKFTSTSQLKVSFNHTVVNLLFPFTFIGDEPLPADIYKYTGVELSYQSDQRRLFSLMCM